MKLAVLIMCSLLGVVALVGGCCVATNNKAIRLEESVQTAKSDIDVQLQNRFNKLTELAGCVKKYDEHEYNTLVKVIEARGKNMSGTEAKQCIAAFSRVEERYPDLKSQKNYQHLMNDISITENSLAQHKKAYNESVRDYRYHCRKFPTSLFLSFTGYVVKKYDMYEAEVHQKDTKPLELF